MSEKRHFLGERDTCVSEETFFRGKGTKVSAKRHFGGKETSVMVKRHFWRKRDICEETVLEEIDGAEFRLCRSVKVEKG